MYWFCYFYFFNQNNWIDRSSFQMQKIQFYAFRLEFNKPLFIHSFISFSVVSVTVLWFTLGFVYFLAILLLVLRCKLLHCNGDIQFLYSCSFLMVTQVLSINSIYIFSVLFLSFIFVVILSKITKQTNHLNQMARSYVFVSISNQELLS